MRSNDAYAFSSNMSNSSTCQLTNPPSTDNVVAVVRDDSNEDVDITQIKLYEGKQTLQNEINILQQKIVFLQAILKNNKCAYDQDNAKLQHQFEEQKATLVFEYDNEQKQLKTKIETHQDTI
jgi:hypothetical protein